jgi:hypothetical protein
MLSFRYPYVLHQWYKQLQVSTGQNHTIELLAFKITIDARRENISLHGFFMIESAHE